MVIAGAMSALLRKGTWVAIASGVFAGGAAIVHAIAGEPRIAVANPPTHEVVSRAIDSEMEVSPSHDRSESQNKASYPVTHGCISTWQNSP